MTVTLSHGFKYLLAGDFKVCISSPGFQTHVIDCICDISALLGCLTYLELNVFKDELIHDLSLPALS